MLQVLIGLSEFECTWRLRPVVPIAKLVGCRLFEFPSNYLIQTFIGVFTIAPAINQGMQPACTLSFFLKFNLTSFHVHQELPDSVPPSHSSIGELLMTKFAGQKKSMAESTVQLMLNYCQ
jgi:hypothetical protein